MTVTPDQSDSSLLQEFAAHRSQDAFTELVSRHSDWVYSAASRMVRDRHLAEDVAQAVFLVMADKADKLSAVPLHRWLFKVTRYASANAIRARSRREKYERRAAMTTRETHESDPDQLWQEIAPMLDDSMSRLRSSDRDALLLRFYQQKNLAEVGAALGVSEGAAKVRILRAVEKLRGILRRRGITVPSDALGAALLVHTTHAAPATFVAGCVPASASVKATALSKGVSTMLISTKIKIAAALILLGGIPIGTGAYFLAGSGDRAVVSPVQSVAPEQSVAPDAETQAVETPAVPAATSGLDPRIAPFVTDRTDLIIAIDFTKFDLDAMGFDMAKELFQSQMDATSTARVNAVMQMALFGGKQWITRFKQCGGSTMYCISRADELTVSSAANTPTMKLSGTIVCPTDSPAAARTLARFLASAGARAPKAVGSAVVELSPSPAPPRASNLPDPRPALAEALSAGGDAPLRAAANPAKLKEIMVKLMASGKLSMTFTDEDYSNIEYASMSVVLPPEDSPGFFLLCHHPNPAAAQRARDWAIERIGRELKELKVQPGSNKAMPTAMANFIKTEAFTVSGSDVMATMDLHAYYRLLFSGIAAATEPPATQPQHAPSQPVNTLN
jgi:RNA polymerase sigma factor (sigma-70 family)